MTILPRSIQGRMLALSAVATLVALAIAGTLIAGVLARVVTEGIDQRLDAELTLMASTVSERGVDRPRLAMLRGALDAGHGWRWRIDAPGEAIGTDTARPAAAAPTGPPGAGGPPPPPGDGHDHRHPDDGDRPHPLDDRDANGVETHARQLIVATAIGSVTLTASAPRNVIERPVLSALTPLIVTLLLLGTILAVAATVQIRLGLRPVRRLRDAVARIRSGESSAIDERQPDELRPLATELNMLIQDNDTALATARTSAANLAHALKTPVATLSLALRGDPRADQVERIDATIRHHLARARSGVAARRSATPLAAAVRDLSGTIERIRRDRQVVVETVIADDILVAVATADLDELAGNLIDNAVRHAAARVFVSAVVEGRRATLTVADDGPGIAAADRMRATQPGIRLDERSDGHGFGLSIVRELAELHGGALSLGDAAGGGLRAVVMLPLAYRDD